MNQRLLWSIAGAGLLAGAGLAWLGLSQQAATQSVSEANAEATEETRLPPRIGALGRLEPEGEVVRVAGPRESG